MKKIVDYFTERFKSFDRDEWLIVAGVFLTLVLLLWFSIGMSVSIAKGYTLFGDTSYTGDDAELVGPTSSDIAVLTLFWILAVAMLALFVYRFFFRPIAKEKASHKEIIDGKTYVIKDEKTTSGGGEEKEKNDGGKTPE